MKFTWSNTFFGNFIFKKITTMGSEHRFYPILVIFLWNKIFSISKKITSVGSSAFQKKLQRLDQPTLVNFLTFFEKNYNDWIKGKLSKSRLRWTGLNIMPGAWKLSFRKIGLWEIIWLIFANQIWNLTTKQTLLIGIQACLPAMLGPKCVYSAKAPKSVYSAKAPK